MVARSATSAKLIQTLVFYDEPQVALLETNRNIKMLAVAIDRPDMTQPFFAAEIKEKTLNRYLDGKVDLNYVLRYTDYKKSYFFDWSLMKQRMVKLQLASTEELKNENLYPEPGFFSRDHTHPYIRNNEETVRHVYNIDGSWEATDFSRFYGKIADIYAFLSIADKLDDQAPDVDDKDFIRRSIGSYFWQGGGSYVNFYNDIGSHIESEYPLKVSRIQYASPGQIELEGKKEIFAEIDSVIANFEASYSELVEYYRNINQILVKEKLKRADRSAQLSSDALDQYVRRLSTDFALRMNIPNPKEIYSVCAENTVVYAKVILSFFRRARAIYLFQVEGRVQPEEYVVRVD